LWLHQLIIILHRSFIHYSIQDKNSLQRIEKSAEEKKNSLEKRNIRLTIINALDLISCFKFI
jgi:hypothetical protein